VSRDSNSICRQCGVYEPGGGLNATLIEWCQTVEEFDAELLRRFNMRLDQLPPDHQNRRIRAFIERHAGHEIEYWSWDWAYGEDDPLEGLTVEAVTGKVQ
jgi:hypothetical protein